MAEQTEQYGVENLKKAVSFTADLAEGVFTVIDDGKVEGKEVLQVASGLMFGALSKLTGIAEVPKEYKDLSTVELKEVVDFFATDFDIKNDTAEKLTEESFKLLAQIIVVGGLVKEARGKASLERTKTA